MVAKGRKRQEIEVPRRAVPAQPQRLIAAVLGLTARKINTPGIDARRSAGLQAAQEEAVFGKRGRQRVVGAIASPSATRARFARDQRATEKGSGRDDGRRGLNLATRSRDDATDFGTPIRSGTKPKANHLVLAEFQSWLILERFFHCQRVEELVFLCPDCLHGRPFAGVEQAELEGRPIGRSRHFASERVDLSDDVALARATDGRIARHVTDAVEVWREDERRASGPRSRERGFASSMSGADDDHVIAWPGKRTHVHREEYTDSLFRETTCRADTKVRHGNAGIGTPVALGLFREKDTWQCDSVRGRVVIRPWQSKKKGAPMADRASDTVQAMREQAAALAQSIIEQAATRALLGAERAKEARTLAETAKKRLPHFTHRVSDDVVPSLREVALNAASAALELWQAAREKAAEAAEEAQEEVAEPATRLVVTAERRAKEATHAVSERIEAVTERAEDVGERAKEATAHAAEATVHVGKGAGAALFWAGAATGIIFYAMLSKERRDQVIKAANAVINDVRELIRDFQGYDEEFA